MLSEKALTVIPAPLALPVPTLAELVARSLTSPHSIRAYARGIAAFLNWYREHPGPLGRSLVLQYRSDLLEQGLSPSTINLRLAALRKLASEAERQGSLDPATSAAIAGVAGVRSSGTRAGNWLTPDQARRLLDLPDRNSLRGIRDHAILALLTACGLRRSELSALQVPDFTERDGRPVIADLRGKGNRLRTVPVPRWVHSSVEQWLQSAGITSGRVFRSVRQNGGVRGERISEKAIWLVVKEYAARIGVPDLAPHDLRRTCAKLCREADGDLEQIQLLLGHASIQTTERYLGTTQKLRVAVNDHLDLGEEAL